MNQLFDAHYDALQAFPAAEMPPGVPPPSFAGDGCNKNRAQVKALLVKALLPDELAVLAAIIFDGSTQCSVAAAMGRSQTWVFRRLHRGIRKLGDGGVRIQPPRRGRRPRLCAVDPAAMDQLKVDSDRVDGQVRGTWKTGHARLTQRPTEA